MMQPRWYQSAAVEAVLKYLREKQGNPIVALPTGCHAKGARILMHDGSVKLVEDVEVGDKLMGPDSRPRTVLRLARGREGMRRVIPVKGEPFVVNASHKLSMKRVRSKASEDYPSQTATVRTVVVSDYEKASDWFKHTHKLRRVSVDFSRKLQQLDPYLVGFMLGDGSLARHVVTFSSIDPEIPEALSSYVMSRGCRITTSDNKNYRIVSPLGRKNPILDDFRALGLGGTRSSTVFVPPIYKTGDRDQRLALLAGLIDADGHLDRSGTYDYITISKQLADDVAFVARSLGLAAYVSYKEARLNGKFISDAWRVCISGDLSIVPCVLTRKKAAPRLQKKDVLCIGFSVEQLPEDDFYGFSLDGDHLYLTDDFTVHHNTGKSLVIAGLIWLIFTMLKWANCRIIVATHDKRLIEQNYKTLLKLWPSAPAGIASAGLRRKDYNKQIVFGGIKSMVGKMSDQWCDLLLIDEAHMCSNKDEGKYCEFILALKSVNPNLRVVGLTATWFRLGQGTLMEGNIFDEMCYNLCDVPGFARLLSEKFLAPVVTPSEPKRLLNLDFSTVARGADGDMRQGAVEKIVDRPDVNFAVLKQAVHVGQDRQSWMIFGAGVEHCDNLQQMLAGAFGVPCVAVHSKMKPNDIDAAFAAFKAGQVRAIINKDMATTGFDHPPLDMIIDLGATMSAAKHVQKIGRGTRIYDPYAAHTPAELSSIFRIPKANCLYLDYVGNIERCGPINDPVIPRAPGEGKGGGDAPIKICRPESLVPPQEGCGNYNHTSVRYCTMCGSEFATNESIGQTASNAAVIKVEDDEPKHEFFRVDRATYTRHVTKAVKRDLAVEGRNWTTQDAFIVKASYYCGQKTFSEFVTVESDGSRGGNFARKKGRDWFRLRHQGDPPDFNSELLEFSSHFATPTVIKVWTNKQPWPEIMEMRFD